MFQDRYIGDSLDVQMLISSGWSLVELERKTDYDSGTNFYAYHPTLINSFAGSKEDLYSLKVS